MFPLHIKKRETRTMGEVVRLVQRHARTSTSRAAKRVRRSAVTPASTALDVDSTDDHHSAGMLSLCHHFVTMPAETPISDPMANLAPWASFGPQSSMTSRNEVISIMPQPLGQLVLKRKAKLSLDDFTALGQNVPMTEADDKETYRTDFIDRVRRARGSTGKKQWEIALSMGVEQDEYKHWESKRLMPHHLIARFCFACHVDPVWMLTGHGRMKGTPSPELVHAASETPSKTKRARGKRVA
jgi:hypothetical protein